MRKFILISLATSVLACQEQAAEDNKVMDETPSFSEEAEQFVSFTESLQATESACVFGGEISGELDLETYEILQVELELSAAVLELEEPPQLEIDTDQSLVDLSTIEKIYNTGAFFDGEELIVVETEAFDLELDVVKGQDSEISGEWYYCANPKSSELPTPEREEEAAIPSRLEQVEDKLSSIRDRGLSTDPEPEISIDRMEDPMDLRSANIGEQ